MSSCRYYIGIDGGGSKTESVLADSQGAIIASTVDKGSAVVGQPSNHSLEILQDAFVRLCSNAGIRKNSITHCVIGLNGIDFPDEYRMQFKAISSRLGLPGSRLSLVNDAIPALWGASSHPASLILQHGTGITSAYRDACGNEKLFDHLNVCQLYDFRHETLAVTARMLSGLLPTGGLSDAVLDHLRISPDEFAETYYRKRLPDYGNSAAFTSMVFKFWVKGDPGARFLIDRTIDDYTAMILAMANKTGKVKVTSVIGGGVVKQAPEEFWILLRARLKSKRSGLTLCRPLFSPAVGAAVMAAFKSRMNIQEYYNKIRSGNAGDETGKR